jgi:hypothetical protein
MIVRIAREGDSVINGSNERGDGSTSLKRVAVAAKRFQNLESNVSRTDTNMVRVTNAEVDMPHIRAISSQDAEMVIGHESA